MVKAQDFDWLHKDQKAESPTDQESTLAKYTREAYVFGGGTLGGAVKEGINAVVERPAVTAVQAAEGVAIGTALTMAKSGPLPVKLLGVAAGGYYTYTTALWLKDDVLSADRWNQLGGVWKDTWRSSANTDKNFNIVQGSLGRLTFDTALMLGTGALGVKVGNIGRDIALAHTTPLKAAEPRALVTEKPAVEKPVVEKAEIPARSTEEIFEGIAKRKPSATEGLSAEELQAAAAVMSNRVPLHYKVTQEVSGLGGKVGWQVTVAGKLHETLLDQGGVLKPGMYERMETAWQLKDLVSQNYAKDMLYLKGKPDRIASIFVVDGVKDAQHLANYAKVHEPALMAFFTDVPNSPLGPHIAEFAKQPLIHELQRHEMANAFVSYMTTGKIPTDAATVKAAHNMWYMDHTLPIEVAAEYSGKPIKEQLTAAAAWNLTLKENGVVREPGGVIPEPLRAKVDWSNPGVRETYARNFQNLQEQGRGAIVTNLGQYNAVVAKHVTEIVHGDKLSDTQMEQLTDAFIQEKANATKVIAAIKSTRFKEALDVVEKNGEDSYMAGKNAVRLTVTFKGAAADWVNNQAKLGRNTHDATYWLPIDEPVRLQGLDKFLFSNSTKPLPDLELAAGRWTDLSAAEKQMPFDQLLFKLRSETYPNAQNPHFAAESAKWGTKPEQFIEYEQRFLAAQKVPSPFPLEKKWEADGLTGRFLPRSDPRGLYLGQHSNCCQHPRGEGSTAAWYGQESPNGGFFVVEDAGHNIVAQSFAWVSETGGLVFDNVEAKGLGKRESAVQKIYGAAAKDLVNEHGVVTVGTGSSDLNLSLWQSAGQLTQRFPQEHDVYRDSYSQVILAQKAGYEAPTFDDLHSAHMDGQMFTLNILNRQMAPPPGGHQFGIPVWPEANRGFPFLRRGIDEKL